MIRYRKLGYVELNVSDLEKSRKFYEDIVGLEFVGKRSDGAVMFRCDDEDFRSVILHQKQPAGIQERRLAVGERLAVRVASSPASRGQCAI